MNRSIPFMTAISLAVCLNCALVTSAGATVAALFLFDRDRPSAVRQSDAKVAESLARQVGLKFGQALYATRFMNLRFKEPIYSGALIKSSVSDFQFDLSEFYLQELDRQKHPIWRATRLDEDFRHLLFALGERPFKSVERKIVFIFSDMIYHLEPNKVDGDSSKGAYLDDGWLTYSRSPFVDRVFNLSGQHLQGADVFIYTTPDYSPFLRSKKQRFFRAMFERLGATLHFFGSYHRGNGAKSQLPAKIFDMAMRGRNVKIPLEEPLDQRVLTFTSMSGSRTVSR